MKIWLINNYNMLPEHGHLNRNHYFGKYLKRLGHEPVVFAGSHPHNTNLQLIEGAEKYRVYQEEPFPWVLIKTRNYEGSKIQRVISMFEFYKNMRIAAKHFEKPDAIIGSSAHPLAAVLAIKMSKKYHCKGIVEIRDLWPESIVAYGVASKNNPIIKILYRLEKWIYKKADAIIFTMEGGKDYIVDKEWDTGHGGPIDLGKVYHINNGVDLEVFDYNKDNFMIEDPELEDCHVKRVIYTGSMREANRSITVLPEVADELLRKGRKDIHILMYGKGDYADSLKAICEKRPTHNLIYKGFVQKSEIPYLLSRACVNILNCDKSDMSKYGGSQNKLFEYLASGHPILSGESDNYSIIINRNCGISKQFNSAEEIADSIIELVDHPEKYADIRSIGEEYDFCKLTKQLINVVEV